MNKKIFNAYIPLFPILIWNLILTSKLPEAFNPNYFNSNIPLLLLIGENIFRSIIFFLPIVCILNFKSSNGKKGLFIYIGGTILYFLSWLALIFFPNSSWSTNIIGFTAPAYTPIIFLMGIALMINSYYFKIKYKKWHYILPTILFSIFHIIHTIYVYFRVF